MFAVTSMHAKRNEWRGSQMLVNFQGIHCLNLS
jgi:hypothetical protein